MISLIFRERERIHLGMELVVLIGEWHVPSCFCNKCQMLELERTAASKTVDHGVCQCVNRCTNATLARHAVRYRIFYSLLIHRLQVNL